MNGKYEYALNRGWDAANYAEAYGEAPTNHYLSTPYEDAFNEGVRRFDNGQWQDGTSRD